MVLVLVVGHSGKAGVLSRCAFYALGPFVPYAGPSCSRQELCVPRKETPAAAGDGTLSLEMTYESLGDSPWSLSWRVYGKEP